MRHFKLVLLVVVVAVAGNAFSLTTQQVPPLPARWSVCPKGPPECQFSKIQEAIKAAAPGDLIQVQAGAYNETLMITKSLQLVGSGRDQVRLQGAEAGKPAITLQVEGELELLLDGLTIVGAPPASAQQPCFRASGPSWEQICPDGIEARGQGNLTLTLVDLQIIEGYTGLACIGPAFKGSVVRLIVLRSRIANNRHSGIAWGCSHDWISVITLSGTTISGNGGYGLSSGQDGNEVHISDSTFSGNRLVGVSLAGHNLKATISHAQFMNNDRGVEIQTGMQGWAKLSQITVMNNGDGVVFFGNTKETSFTLQDSTLQGNGGVSWGAGLLFATRGTVEIQGNLIRENQHGIIIGPTNLAKISDNRILGNKGWGIALGRPPCFEYEGPVGVVEATIQGMNNEISANEKGDLCPPDFPWPPGFVKP